MDSGTGGRGVMATDWAARGPTDKLSVLNLDQLRWPSLTDLALESTGKSLRMGQKSRDQTVRMKLTDAAVLG